MVAACPFPAARGTPIRVRRIAEEIGQRGHDVDVFTYHLGSEPGQPPYRIHRIPRVRTYQKESPGPSLQKLLLLDPLLALRLMRFSTKHRFDVIHAHHVEGLLAGLPTSRLRRVPLVFDAHTLLQSELPFYRTGLPKAWLERIGGCLDLHLPQRADHVIVVSERIRTAFLERSGVQPERVSLVPNGVEDTFFERLSSVSPRTAGGASRVVFAGNLAAYQGVNMLLEAFALATRSRPDLRLRIVTGDRFDNYEARSNALGIRDRIELRDASLDELPGELSEAAVAVNPRTACDGLPQKLLNYMAAACPIVSFSGSARHVEHGQSALVVADGDVQAFADAIVRLVNDPELARRLGTSARAFVRSELTWNRAAERIEQVYMGLTEAREAGRR